MIAQVALGVLPCQTSGGGTLKSMSVTHSSHRTSSSGFTVIELLIVIVVIAVLAAITVVAYNGIQARAHNSSMVSAVSQWAKIIMLYKADTGAYPTMSACLGSGYGAGIENAPVSIATDGDCRQQNTESSSVLKVSAPFNALVSPYVNGPGPNVPIITATTSSSYPYYRGAYFYAAYSTVPARIDFVLKGPLTSCPQIGGLTMSSTITLTGGVRCSGNFPNSL